MSRTHPSDVALLNRRDALRLGIAASAGVALGTHGFRLSFADGTPSLAGGYVHPEALVSVEWLQEHIHDEGLVLVGFMPPEEFEAARIPNSVHSAPPPFEVIDTSDASIEAWHKTAQELLGAMGISADSTVVAYDNATLFSARLWWLLHYFGHEHVHILDGGLPAWESADGELESGAAESPAGSDPYQGTPNPDLLAQRDEVLASLDDPDVVILDARTLEEYAEGHIPGAVNLNFPLNAAEGPPKFFKSVDELRAMYDEVGATAGKLVVPYCASGVRSAVTAFSLYLIGHEDVALYTGSWLEWGEDPETPKTEGEEP